MINRIYDVFCSFNDNVFPGYKDFPNSNLIINLRENKRFGLIEYIKQNKKFVFENDKFCDL